MKTVYRVLIALGAVPVLVIAAAVAAVAARDKPGEVKATASAAKYACEQFIEKRAKDPASLSFEDRRDWVVLSPAAGGTVWRVMVELRARNGFGAMGRHRVECAVQFAPEGWKLAKLS